VVEINGKMTWIFHGDVFDHANTGLAKWWGKLGSNGYAILLAFNRCINWIMKIAGKEKLSLSKRVMEQFNKRFVKIKEFENKIAELAIEKNYNSVICGHIHQPEKRVITTDKGSVNYLNSGDWVEHLTALEYHENDWHLYKHSESAIEKERVSFRKPSPQVMTNEIGIYMHSLNPHTAII